MEQIGRGEGAQGANVDARGPQESLTQRDAAELGRGNVEVVDLGQRLMGCREAERRSGRRP